LLKYATKSYTNTLCPMRKTELKNKITEWH
jgi:hypothetical protein